MNPDLNPVRKREPAYELESGIDESHFRLVVEHEGEDLPLDLIVIFACVCYCHVCNLLLSQIREICEKAFQVH